MGQRPVGGALTCVKIQVNKLAKFVKPPLLEDTVADHFGKIVSDYGDRHAFVLRRRRMI